MFGILVSKILSAKDLESLLADILPGTTIQVSPDTPEPLPDVWIVTYRTLDSHWPLRIEFLIFPINESNFGSYPDMRLIELLSERYGLNALCGVNDLVPGVDPYDPCWQLAYVDERWYLADIARTPLLGFSGSEEVKLVRRVVVRSREKKDVGPNGTKRCQRRL
jgi:hypothetical protein